MITEAEAKTKWCPFARYAFTDVGGVNRWKQSAPENEPHALNPVPCRCIGSECMMWRWDTGVYRSSIVTPDGSSWVVEPPRPKAVPASWEFVARSPADLESVSHWVEPWAEAQARRRGSCGLTARGE
jgi:hypothetical protein